MSRIDNLEFLSDVIPKTTTYKQFKEKKAKEAAKNAVVEKGQRTLNGTKPTENGVERPRDISILRTDSDDYHQSIGSQPRITSQSPGSLSTLMVDRTVEDQGRGPSDRDVEMTG